MILVEDVIAVMDGARESGEVIYDEESAMFIARRRSGNATFWVKFTQDAEGGYLVHRVWSHRMNVVKREG